MKKVSLLILLIFLFCLLFFQIGHAGSNNDILRDMRNADAFVKKDVKRIKSLKEEKRRKKILEVYSFLKKIKKENMLIKFCLERLSKEYNTQELVLTDYFFCYPACPSSLNFDFNPDNFEAILGRQRIADDTCRSFFLALRNKNMAEYYAGLYKECLRQERILSKLNSAVGVLFMDTSHILELDAAGGGPPLQSCSVYFRMSGLEFQQRLYYLNRMSTLEVSFANQGFRKNINLEQFTSRICLILNDLTEQDKKLIKEIVAIDFIKNRLPSFFQKKYSVYDRCLVMFSGADILEYDLSNMLIWYARSISKTGTRTANLIKAILMSNFGEIADIVNRHTQENEEFRKEFWSEIQKLKYKSIPKGNLLIY